MAAGPTTSRGDRVIESPTGHRSPQSRPGLHTTVLILLATIFPVASLYGASLVAKTEVERRAREGLAAIGQATVLQEEQAWDNAVRVVTSAASRPVPLSAIQSRDTELAALGLQNILTTGPFATVRIYDSAGTLIATAAMPGATPTPVSRLGSPATETTFETPVVSGTQVVRQVAVPVGFAGRGRLVVDVDITQLLGKPSDLGFGRTGAKFLVTPAGTVVAGSTAVGMPLQSAENRAIAAARRPVTRLIYSPFFKRLTVESYQPIPGQDMGIFVQQARSEIMGGADHLATLLRGAAFAVALLGALLAGSLGVILGRRSRRLAASRKQTQEAQARLASIVQASHEAILGKTLDGIITSWNPGAETLFGYSTDEMIGTPIEVLIPEEDRQTEGQLRERVARGHGVEQHECVRIRKDGTRVDVSTTLSPIDGTGGRVTGIATICRDISERKRAEAALRHHEEQLAAARDQALEASRLKTQFLSNTSHEIRTPMTVIVGMNEMLEETDLDPTQRKFVEAASRASASLMDIISDILDFSKIEAGRVDLKIGDVEIRPLVEDVSLLMSDAARLKGLQLVCTFLPDVPEFLRGDTVRLRQVLLNLVSNAVKFTDDGRVEVRVSRRSSPRGTVVRIEIIDSGIGIAAENQRLLFQPFSQVDASSTRSYGGTGLGLAISAELVEAMGGVIGVASSPESGSTFWFELPATAGLGNGYSSSSAGAPAAVTRRRDTNRRARLTTL
jgi:PAS domain S-box-containing protein